MYHTFSLLVPDLHQDSEFLSRILERESVEEFGNVILMGDYFDGRYLTTRGPGAARATARLIRQLDDRLGGRLVLLWGNHDLPYFFFQRSLELGGRVSMTATEQGRLLGIRPESEACVRAVSEEWPIKFWKKLRPFAVSGGYLVSHAGIHPTFYPKGPKPITSALKVLRRRWDEALGALVDCGRLDPLLDAGEARGGREGALGGILWLDWEREFQCGLPIGQIVAHSAQALRRNRDRSHCIDYGQCAYALLGDGLDVRGI